MSGIYYARPQKQIAAGAPGPRRLSSLSISGLLPLCFARLPGRGAAATPPPLVGIPASRGSLCVLSPGRPPGCPDETGQKTVAPSGRSLAFVRAIVLDFGRPANHFYGGLQSCCCSSVMCPRRRLLQKSCPRLPKFFPPSHVRLRLRLSHPPNSLAYREIMTGIYFTLGGNTISKTFKTPIPLAAQGASSPLGVHDFAST